MTEDWRSPLEQLQEAEGILVPIRDPFLAAHEATRLASKHLDGSGWQATPRAVEKRSSGSLVRLALAPV